MKLFSRILFAVFLVLILIQPIQAKKSQDRLWQYKRTHFNYYSVKDEVAIGEEYIKKQIKAFEKKKLAVNPKEYSKTIAKLNTIMLRLAKVSDMPNLPFDVTLFDKKDVANAYCLPGGKMGVFTGLFDKEKGMIDMDNDDEIAAVLAHEIAHATLRHVTRGMTTANSIGFLGNIITLGVTRGVGDGWGYLAGQIFNTGTFLYFPSYSRKHEKEADKVGLYYMAKAGFNVQAAIDVWERAAHKAQKKGKSKTNFFDSHPASGERAAYLKSFYNDALEVQAQQKDLNKMYKKMRE